MTIIRNFRNYILLKQIRIKLQIIKLYIHDGLLADIFRA